MIIPSPTQNALSSFFDVPSSLRDQEVLRPHQASLWLTLALAVAFPLFGRTVSAGFDFGLLHNKSTIRTFLHLHSLEGEDHDVPAQMGISAGAERS